MQNLKNMCPLTVLKCKSLPKLHESRPLPTSAFQSHVKPEINGICSMQMHPELLNKSCVKTLPNVQIYLLGSKLRILSAAGEQVQFKDA